MALPCETPYRSFHKLNIRCVDGSKYGRDFIFMRAPSGPTFGPDLFGLFIVIALEHFWHNANAEDKPRKRSNSYGYVIECCHVSKL